LQLAGVMFVPADVAAGGRRPGIVLCQGFSGIKDALLPDVARRLAGAGYVAMTFDYRYFGESAGEPRWRVLPWAQVQDIRNAITFLAEQPEVDPRSLGLYGTSFGGANVSYTAAVDARVQCAVSTVGIGDGERWLRGLRRHWEWRALLRRVAEDRRRRVLTGTSEYVPTLEVMLPDPDTQRFWDKTTPRALELFPHMGTEITLESVDAVVDFKPETVVDRIAPRPILWIHAGEDVLVPADESRRMYERAREPKKLVILEGLGHWDVYRDVGFEQVVQATLAWYREWLPVRAG
jgi:dienelactone hydrolase